MRQASKLIANIQILRGLAALLVVLCHAVYSTHVTQPGFSLGRSFDHFGTVGVDLFFIISGFIIAHTAFVGQRPKPLDFARRRFWRIVPLYYLLALPWLGFALYDGGLDGGRLIASILFWPATDQMNMPYLDVGWTLCFEMLFYAAATLCLCFPGWKIPAMLLATYLLCWMAGVITHAPAMLFLGNPIIVEFLLGVAIAHLVRQRAQRAGSLALLTGIGILLVTILEGYGEIHNARLIIDGTHSLQRLLVWGSACGLIVLAAVLMRDWRLGALPPSCSGWAMPPTPSTSPICWPSGASKPCSRRRERTCPLP